MLCVEIVSVDENVGFPDCGENAAVAPDGMPLADSVTVCGVPLTSVTVIVLEPLPPGATEMPPLFDNEKSKVPVQLESATHLDSTEHPAGLHVLTCLLSPEPHPPSPQPALLQSLQLQSGG